MRRSGSAGRFFLRHCLAEPDLQKLDTSASREATELSRNTLNGAVSSGMISTAVFQISTQCNYQKDTGRGPNRLVNPAGRAYDRCLKQPDCRCSDYQSPLTGQCTAFVKKSKSVRKALCLRQPVNRESQAVHRGEKEPRKNCHTFTARKLLDFGGHTDHPVRCYAAR